MLSRQQRRLRQENFHGDVYVDFSEKTCNDGQIKLVYYGTLQNLYDYEYNIENEIEI